MRRGRQSVCLSLVIPGHGHPYSDRCRSRRTHNSLHSKAEGKKDWLRAAFTNYPSKAHDIIDRVKEASIFENAVYDTELLTEWSKGPVALIGDAAQAITPVFGQGTNIGLESACDFC
jgi:2-polyprenyl-6-methoxyphenol hydroxylase-like FAD-dependent oxidoreductase